MICLIAILDHSVPQPNRRIAGGVELATQIMLKYWGSSLTIGLCRTRSRFSATDP